MTILSRSRPLFIYQTAIWIPLWPWKGPIFEKLPLSRRVKLIHYLRIRQQVMRNMHGADNSRLANYVLTEMLVYTVVNGNMT